MKITRVEIRNWRSIKDVDFCPENVTVLVGPNNAGKSNILSAINFLLGDRWPMHANLTESDYFNGEMRRDIYIRLGLDHPRYGSVEFDTSKDKYMMSAHDHDGRLIVPFSSVQRDELSFAYVDAARNFDRQFGLSRWTLFGQSIRRLHTDLKTGGGEALDRLKVVLEEAHGLLRTELYQVFERELKAAFGAQLRTSRYDVSFEFKTIDEANLYRNLYPVLQEGGRSRAPAEAGSGVRNLLVLALFQAVARTFRSGAVLGIEEPELYLHPHAQRGLMRQFDELVAEGNQVIVSTHSAAFLDIAKSERIVLVERCGDEEEDVCTQSRTTNAEKHLRLRQRLHPSKGITDASRRAFLHNIGTPEMAEAFFARLVVVVEGPTEREALRVLLPLAGIDLDAEGVSLVSAGGKPNLDTIVHLYQAHQLPVYVIFDNDSDKGVQAHAGNRLLCRLLAIPTIDVPPEEVAATFAVLERNWEHQLDSDLDELEFGLYDQFATDARRELNITTGSKPLVARFVAERLVERDHVPAFVQAIAARLSTMLRELDGTPGRTGAPSPFDDEIPF